MVCGKCGAEVPDGNEFCGKCGAKLESSISEAPSEKADKKVDAKKFLPIIIVLAGVLIVVGSIWFIKQNTKKNGLYENLAWGTDIDTVSSKMQKKYPNPNSLSSAVSGSSSVFNFTKNEDNDAVIGIIEDYKGRKGVTCAVVLSCEKNASLSDVGLIFSVSGDSEYTNLKLFDELESEYTKLFGKPDEHSKYLCEWITSNSKVKLQYLPSKENGLVYVDYSPID